RYPLGKLICFFIVFFQNFLNIRLERSDSLVTYFWIIIRVEGLSIIIFIVYHRNIKTMMLKKLLKTSIFPRLNWIAPNAMDQNDRDPINFYYYIFLDVFFFNITYRDRNCYMFRILFHIYVAWPFINYCDYAILTLMFKIYWIC